MEATSSDRRDSADKKKRGKRCVWRCCCVGENGKCAWEWLGANKIGGVRFRESEQNRRIVNKGRGGSDGDGNVDVR